MEEEKTESTPRRMETENTRLLNHRIQVDDDNRQFEHNNIYQSCCLRIDKRALQFFTQALFSLLVIIFCIVNLTIKEGKNTEIYISLLTFILGVFLPSPNMRQD